MKRYLLILTLLINNSVYSLAQSPAWQWAKSAGGMFGDVGIGISTDANGNVLAAGNFGSDSITFGTITLTNTGNFGTGDIWIVKYDASGNVLWAKSAGGTSLDYVTAIITDISGNVLVTGSFANSITFGTTTLVNGGGSGDIYIVKYDAAGNVLWAKSAGGTSYVDGTAIATDGSGNVLVTGYFQSPSITFGTTVLTNAGSDDIFVVKYDSAGNVVWAKGSGGNDYDKGNGISCDADANVLVTGYFRSPSITFDTIVLTNAGDEDIFVVKYDSSGNVLWAQSAGGTSGEQGSCISTDSNGNVLMSGIYNGPDIAFGTTVLTNTFSGFSDVFVVIYNTSGNVLWAQSGGGIYTDEPNGITSDGIGNVLVTGYFVSPSITFGTNVLTTAGFQDIFIVKYDSSGNDLWAVSTGGTDDDRGNSISSDANGNILITGYFYSPSIVFGATTLINTASTGIPDLFVAKLDSIGITGIAEENSAPYSITIFPNPVNSILNLFLNTKENILITNLTGEILLQKDAIGKVELDISSLSPGLYFIKAGNEVRKLVKE